MRWARCPDGRAKALTRADKALAMEALGAGKKLDDIAAAIGVTASWVSRFAKRNGKSRHGRPRR